MSKSQSKVAAGRASAPILLTPCESAKLNKAQSSSQRKRAIATPQDESEWEESSVQSSSEASRNYGSKRVRQENWSDEEVLLLVELYQKHFSSQPLRGMTKALKDHKWLVISKEFATLSPQVPRNLHSLLSKFKCLKAYVKRTLLSADDPDEYLPIMSPAEKLMVELFYDSQCFTDVRRRASFSNNSIEDIKRKLVAENDNHNHNHSHNQREDQELAQSSKNSEPVRHEKVTENLRRPRVTGSSDSNGNLNGDCSSPSASHQNASDQAARNVGKLSTEKLQREVLRQQMRICQQQEALLSLRSVKNQKAIELLDLQVTYLRNKMTKEGLLPGNQPQAD